MKTKRIIEIAACPHPGACQLHAQASMAEAAADQGEVANPGASSEPIGSDPMSLSKVKMKVK